LYKVIDYFRMKLNAMIERGVDIHSEEAKEIPHPHQIHYIAAFKEPDELVTINLEYVGHLPESPLQQDLSKLLEGLPR
jgi:hypothetical protein